MSDGYRSVARFDADVAEAMVRIGMPDCGGPDRCVNDMCRGYDEGICGRPSDAALDEHAIYDEEPGGGTLCGHLFAPTSSGSLTRRCVSCGEYEAAGGTQ